LSAAFSFDLRSAGKNSFLDPFHFLRACGRRVVEPMEMQQAMDDVKAQLALERCPENLRLTARGFGADEQFTVFKSDDIRRSANLHESSMQIVDLPVRNDENVNLPQAAESAGVVSRQRLA
jgi:hypothetical protein